MVFTPELLLKFYRNQLRQINYEIRCGDDANGINPGGRDVSHSFPAISLSSGADNLETETITLWRITHP